MFHRSSPSLRGHMRMASYVAGELIPCAFVWHDPRNYPMLQKSLMVPARSDSLVQMRFAAEAGDDGAA